MSVDIDTHASGLTAGIPVVRLPGPYRLSDSGGNALYDVLPGGRGFVMTQLSDAEKREGNSLHIVLNWARELTERLP
jgi:hypothetical protein